VKATPDKSTSKPPTSKTSRRKVSIDQQFNEWGREVERIEKGIPYRPEEAVRFLGDLAIVELGGLNEDQIKVIEVLAKAYHGQQIKSSLSRIRQWVEHDQTEPIPAKHVGRALNDLGALDDVHAVSRIQIFAFFARGLALAVLPKSGSPDYREIAEACRAPGGMTVNLKNSASKSLAKPIERLESLRLADARREKGTGKREASYLLAIGREVFNGWPLWPDEPPIAPAP
jgi:hypothetical protein